MHGQGPMEPSVMMVRFACPAPHRSGLALPVRRSSIGSMKGYHLGTLPVTSILPTQSPIREMMPGL